MTSTGQRSPRTPSTPKRDRVRRHILDVIEKAGPGTSLASERDLANELGVSRPTIRAAIDELVRSGLLVRQHGRGTFTSPQKITQELPGSTGLAVPPAEGTWISRVVAFTIAPAGWSRASRLSVEPDDEVLRVTRVRLVDGEPIAIERLELPAVLVPGLAPQDMETGNFYQLLRERYGINVTEAVQTLEPSVTNPEQADLLDVTPYFPIMCVERTTQDDTGRTIEYVQSAYRGDRYRITTKLHFDHTSG
ncbi:GntR family transcriptional regulator [Actinoallomurus purpureus]|uniref:GntR family transcriptional regulator n=1 Tax=Actinoallomurus purpureus TaxID=478114 RepID=UPI002092422C|nr:GntR family transcriptional regulator [Actinoallomurus purpureus]MCO6006931.1 GntR family transcriptional regulator [Actinoallomurus purpureus]